MEGSPRRGGLTHLYLDAFDGVEIGDQLSQGRVNEKRLVSLYLLNAIAVWLTSCRCPPRVFVKRRCSHNHELFFRNTVDANAQHDDL